MIKNAITLAITFFISLAAFAQQQEQMTIEDWNYEAANDIRLLPKYGNAAKTAAQQAYDENFINTAMQDGKYQNNRLAASNDFIKKGFDYLYQGDLKKAMYRFNQAYLLDSTNSEIYLGYGAIYLSLRDFDKAETQYRQGLQLNPRNSHLLTDYGTYYLGKYYDAKMQNKNDAASLDAAITQLTAAYEMDPKDQNISYKLSICYWHKGDCGNAIKYYNVCKALGGQPILSEYEKDLMKKCRM